MAKAKARPKRTKSKVPTKAQLEAGWIGKVPGVDGLEFRLEYCNALIPKLGLAVDAKAARNAWPDGTVFEPENSELEDIAVWVRFAGTKDRWSLLGPTQELKKHWFERGQFKEFKVWLQQVAALAGGCVFGSCWAGEIDVE